MAPTSGTFITRRTVVRFSPCLLWQTKKTLSFQVVPFPRYLNPALPVVTDSQGHQSPFTCLDKPQQIVE
jgi:hypothetical protein